MEGKPVTEPPEVHLDNLDLLNQDGDKRRVALTSDDDVTDRPEWLYGEEPDADGKLQNATASVIIVVEKETDIVDAFYFYFYSYDEGGNMTQVKEPFGSFIGDQDGMHIGNHVGDWYVWKPPVCLDRTLVKLLTRKLCREHSMVRFRGGKPEGIYYSQHSGGAAYDWDDDHLTIEDGRVSLQASLVSSPAQFTDGCFSHMCTARSGHMRIIQLRGRFLRSLLPHGHRFR